MSITTTKTTNVILLQHLAAKNSNTLLLQMAPLLRRSQCWRQQQPLKIITDQGRLSNQDFKRSVAVEVAAFKAKHSSTWATITNLQSWLLHRKDINKMVLIIKTTATCKAAGHKHSSLPIMPTTIKTMTETNSRPSQFIVKLGMAVKVIWCSIHNNKLIFNCLSRVEQLAVVYQLLKRINNTCKCHQQRIRGCLVEVRVLYWLAIQSV